VPSDQLSTAPDAEEPGCLEGPAARGAASLPDAVAAFLTGGDPARGFTHVQVHGYRVLCTAATGCRRPLLLGGDDGAVYVPEESPAAEAPVESLLRRHRLRPTREALTLRFPAELGGRALTFRLWASPQYSAAVSDVPQVWK
jgi:hypothetical protein